MPGKRPGWQMRLPNPIVNTTSGRRTKKPFETKTFIEEQLKLTSNRLRLAEQELQAFKESYALISLDAQTQNTLNRLYTVETEYEKVKIDKAEAKSQLRMIEAAIYRQILI